MSAYRLPTWDEAPAIGQPKKKKKKKKPPQKRFVGPTIQATEKGLAGPGVGKQNTAYPEKMSGVSRSQQLSGEWTQDLDTAASKAQITPVGSLLAQGTMSLGAAPMTMTPQEATVRNISIAYFQQTGVLPDPAQVLALLNNPATRDLSVEQYAKLLDGVSKVPSEYEGTRVGLFHNKQITRDNPEYGQPGTRMPGKPEGIGPRHGAPEPATPATFTMTMEGNPDKDLIRQDMLRLQRASRRGLDNSMDAALTADPKAELMAFSEMLAQRNRNRNDPVEWDTDKPWDDPDFLRAAAMYAMGPRWAYMLYGSDKDKKNAQESIDYLRSLPFTKESWDEMGKKVGVSVADWSDKETFGMVIDAMRHTDSEFVKTAVWDAWLYGREKDTSPSQSVFEYADKFGVDKLPMAQQEEYARSEYSIAGVMEKAMGGAAEAWKSARHVPWLGKMLWPIDKVGYAANYGFGWATEELMKRAAVVIDIAYQGNPEIYEKGYTQQEYVDAVLGGEMDPAKFTDSMKLWEYNWGVFVDGSRIAAAMENNKGRNPFGILAETASVETTGEIRPWAKDIGDLAHFAAIFYLGAKVGDPLARASFKYAGKGAFAGGRATELYIKGARARYGAKGAESGEWVLRVGKKDVDALPENVRNEYHRLKDEYDSIDADLSRDAAKDYTPPRGADSPDIATDYRSVKDYILARGGFKHSPEALTADKAASLGERRGSSHGLVKKSGQAVDELVDEMVEQNPGLPFRDPVTGKGDVNAFWEWMDAQREALRRAPKGRNSVPAGDVDTLLARQRDIEGRVAYMLSTKRLPDDDLLSAPDRMFAADDYIGEGKQAGLDIAVDETAAKTKPFGEVPEKGVEPMPGQVEMPKTGYKVGDKVRVAKPSSKDISGKKLDVDREVAGTIEEIDTLPDGTVEYKVSGVDQPWHTADEILGMERRAVERPRAAATDAQGVKVSPVEIGGKAIEVDASIAADVEWLNKSGYKTHQSHGLKEDHPAGHPARKAAPYVEFAYQDLKVGGKANAKAGAIRAAARRAGAEVEKGKATIDGKTHSTLLVRGDIAKFTKELGRKEPVPATQRPIEGVSRPPEGPSTPAPRTALDESRAEMLATIFRRENEVIAAVDSPALLKKMYQIPEENLAAQRIAEELAITTDIETVNRLVGQLANHGIEIDALAGAFFKNMRQAAYRKGLWRKGPTRFFITPALYEQSHRINGSTDAAFAYMELSKLGMSKLDDAGWARIRELRDTLSKEHNPLKKQNIIEAISDEIEANIIREKGSLDGLNKWKRLHATVRGERLLADIRSTAYLPEFGPGGTMFEGSRVSSPGKAGSHVKAQLAAAQKHFDELAKDAPAADVARAQKAIDAAGKMVVQIEKDIADYLKLVKKKSHTVKEQKRLAECEGTINSYGSDVPFLQQQGMNHITFRHNPLVLAAYMGGKPAMAAALVDTVVFQPIMTLFKETVMGSLGFAIKVNAGDEYTRLIAEGVPKRMGKAKALRREMRAQGIWGEDLDAALHDSMAMDWVGSGSSRMVMKSFDDPQYYKFLSEDLYRWGKEPVVKRLMEKHGGEFPQDPGDVKAFIAKIVNESSEDGRLLREHLSNTYRFEGGSIDNASFTKWAQQMEDRLIAIGRNPTLRAAVKKRMKPELLKRGTSEKELWPVNAPENTAYVGSNWNPLNIAVRANPFHYIYQGIPVGGKIAGKLGGEFANSGKVGTLQMLGSMSNWLRETMFTDRYYLERQSILAKNPELEFSKKGLVELHEAAATRAMNFTNHATYSTSATMFEHMTRNLIPFGSAYRQFWQYWLATFAKHPASMTAWMEGYSTLIESTAGLAGQVSEAVGGPDISAKGQFLSVGDYQMFLPAVPFFAVRDQGPEDETGEGGMGTLALGTAASNLPQASFLVTTPARTLIGWSGGDPADYSDIPGLAGLTNMPPFGRQGRLLYGVFGWNGWDQSELATGLLGDPKKLSKAHANAILDQMRYDDKGTGTGAITRDKPMWWRATEGLLGLVGRRDVKPEALFAETWKSFMPLPATASYSPQATREKGNWLFEYYDKIGKGDSEGAATMRQEHKWLDTYLDYYDADYEGRNAMKKDPANADILKFWVSPYNYNDDGEGYDGSEWQDQWTNGRRSYKSDQEYIASIHNLYTDIYGGTYVEQRYGKQIVRKGGEEYAGDIAREQAAKNAKKKMEQALKWAKAKSAQLAKERGWDAEWLMAKFTDPKRDWGVWPGLLKEAGLDENQYNIDTIAKVFASGYGGDLDNLESGYKVKAPFLGAEDALRALDLARWLPDPDMRRRFIEETPFAGDIKKTQKQQKTDIIKAVVDSAVSDQWYTLGSQQLSVLGVKVSPKVDAVLMDLHSDYLAMQKLTTGSSEYKAARNAYYAKRDKQLGRLKGGKLISGGVADRLIALPYVLEPAVTLMGTGRNAVKLQKSWNNFDKAMRLELAKKSPDPNHIGMAWDKLVGWQTYSPKQQSELTRITAWAFVIASGKKMRRDLMTHYSDYYKAPGESAASKYGSQRVDEFNKIVKQMRQFSPSFAKQADEWFGKDRNLGTLFLSWYDY